MRKSINIVFIKKQTMTTFSIQGNIVDIKSKTIFWGTVQVADGIIVSISKEGEEKKEEHFITQRILFAKK